MTLLAGSTRLLSHPGLDVQFKLPERAEKRKFINKTDALQRPIDQPATKGQIKLICKGTPEQIEAE